jgi:epoxyqueuosine reductase QueG
MEKFVRSAVTRFINEYPDRFGTATRWREPLVAFADAADPLFPELKSIVIPSHAAPGDLLAGARTVICWFVPFTRELGRLNYDGSYAHESWAVAYVETNRMLAELCRRIAAMLEAQGERCAVLPPTHNYYPKKLVSDWSHKSAAYIAGLGRFGLNRQMITEQGCCGRLGSLVTTAAMEPTPRPQHEHCLYLHDGSCAKCAQRCPIQCLTKQDYDRRACHLRLRENERIFEYIGLADVCGKCVANLPCSYRIPAPSIMPL